MVVEARLGIFRGAHVSVDGVRYGVHRLPGSWYEVDAPLPTQRGRVHYSGWRDVLRVERGDGILEIRFRLRGTLFTWKGRTYRVGSMVWGRIAIDEGARPIVRGAMTWSGVRLDHVSADFAPIGRDLAFGLALRSTAVMQAALISGAVGV